MSDLKGLPRALSTHDWSEQADVDVQAGDLSDAPTLHVIEVGGDRTPSVSGRIVLSVPVPDLPDVAWARV